MRAWSGGSEKKKIWRQKCSIRGITGYTRARESQLADAFMIKNPPTRSTRACKRPLVGLKGSRGKKKKKTGPCLEPRPTPLALTAKYLRKLLGTAYLILFLFFSFSFFRRTRDPDHGRLSRVFLLSERWRWGSTRQRAAKNYLRCKYKSRYKNVVEKKKKST